MCVRARARVSCVVFVCLCVCVLRGVCLCVSVCDCVTLCAFLHPPLVHAHHQASDVLAKIDGYKAEFADDFAGTNGRSKKTLWLTEVAAAGNDAKTVVPFVNELMATGALSVRPFVAVHSSSVSLIVYPSGVGRGYRRIHVHVEKRPRWRRVPRRQEADCATSLMPL